MPGAGAADEAEAAPFSELGEHVVLLDMQFGGEFEAVPVAAGLAEQDRSDQLRRVGASPESPRQLTVGHREAG